jgi:hypothetical protein
MPDIFNGGYIYESAHMGWMVCFTCEDGKGNSYMYGDLVDAHSEEHAREIMLNQCREEALPAQFTTHRYEDDWNVTAFIPKKEEKEDA